MLAVCMWGLEWEILASREPVEHDFGVSWFLVLEVARCSGVGVSKDSYVDSLLDIIHSNWVVLLAKLWASKVER